MDQTIIILYGLNYNYLIIKELAEELKKQLLVY